MSGSYTQTPNLGLYKPTPNSDAGTWGYHLNSNADLLDSLLGTSGGYGSLYLPLAGGTMSGPLTLAADPVAGPAGAMQAVTRRYVDASGTVQQWTAGPVSTVGLGLTLSGAVLASQWTAGAVGSVGAGLTLSGNALTGQWSAGAVNTVGTGLTLSGGLLSATAGASGVTSYNTRTGAVTAISADVTNALGYTPYNGATNPNGYQTSSQVSSALAGYLPLTGGTVSGAVAMQSSLTVTGTIQANATVGCAGLCAFGYPTVTDFYIRRTGGFRSLQWSANDSMSWSESTSYVQWVHASNVIMSIDPSGNFAIGGANATKVGGSASWTVSSDDRVKRDVEPYTHGLTEVCALRPISFEYNGKGGTQTVTGKRFIGLSAQATQKPMPELVVEISQEINPEAMDGQLGTDLGPLTLALCNAVRELAERMAALEASRSNRI